MYLQRDILRKIELLLISLIVLASMLASITLAVSSPSKQTIIHNRSYNNHSLSFEVPQNWSVVKDFQKGNDTQIVLSDSNNAIRIDLIKHLDMNKIIGNYLEYHVSMAELASFDIKNTTATEWHSAYERVPWYSNEAISEYYMEYVITPIALVGNNYHGSGISVKPDGVEYAGFYTNEYSPQHPGHSVDVYEWIIAWTKPNYDNEIIGVHSAFRGEFHEIKLEMNGSNEEYLMPEPLWTVLTTLNRGNKPLSKPLSPLHF